MGACHRRTFTTAVTGGLLGSCADRRKTETARVRLRARLGTPAQAPEPGVHPLNLRHGRDALLYLPESLAEDRPAPLIVFLHGAGGDEQGGLRFLTPYADAFAFVLLAPSSEDGTWDAVGSAYGPDVRFIDRSLERAFERCWIDPNRVAVSGFSDGASYALGLGLSNGGLFRSVMAFSPGFVPRGVQPDGRPRFFLSHGTADRVLPIDQCSRTIVPKLTRAGYHVTFREFDGPHTLPRDVGDEAMRWFLT
jgi:phospholipase/carboxylesterase